jgi:hypothetical protein
MKRLAIAVATTVVATAFLPVAVAQAHHPLTKREAVREVREDAFDNYDVDYFHRQPSCFRMSRYLFKCVAVVVYFDGDSDCIRGPVRAYGPNHHSVRVNMHLC